MIFYFAMIIWIALFFAVLNWGDDPLDAYFGVGVFGGLILFLGLGAVLNIAETNVKENLQSKTKILYSLEPNRLAIGRGQTSYHYKSAPGALVTDSFSGSDVALKTSPDPYVTLTWDSYTVRHDPKLLPSWFWGDGGTKNDNYVIHLPKEAVLVPIN